MGRVLPILFNTDMVRAILDGRKKARINDGCIYEVEQPCDECRMCGKGQGIQAVNAEKTMLCNCDGCKNNNTDECMHCMRAYSDCYEREA